MAVGCCWHLIAFMFLLTNRAQNNAICLMISENLSTPYGGVRIVPWLAKRNTEHGSGLGRWRWVVERIFAWLNQFRRLRVRYEKRADIREAFLSLGCALICWRFLRVDWWRVETHPCPPCIDLSQLGSLI
jgi:hypothetical protein